MRELIHIFYVLGGVVTLIYYWYITIKEYRGDKYGSITFFDIIASLWVMIGSWLSLTLILFGDRLDEIKIISKEPKNNE